MQDEPEIPQKHSYSRFIFVCLLFSATLAAQTATPHTVAGPIALVPLGDKNPASAATVTGSLEVTEGKAIIAASGSVTAGTHTAEVTLPHRGTLRVCASTTVKLAADTAATSSDEPGLLMALNRGALEASFATGSSADVLLTPDFRILISGPGAVDLKVRLSENGDTCVDNAGINAPYVLVTSVFDATNYRVQPGQRVMFQHGSVEQVVDNEKEPCGCPPDETKGNAFPMSQSAGLAPMAKPALAPAAAANGPTTAPLVYKSEEPQSETEQPGVTAPEATGAAPQPVQKSPAKSSEKKPGLFGKLGRFFKRLFGAD